MKKIIAAMLSLMLLLSVCTVSAIPAAAESVERTIVDFDGTGPAYVKGSGQSTIGMVEDVGEGNVAVLYIEKWQSFYIQLPANFGFGNPTHLNFWAKTDVGKVGVTNNGNGLHNADAGTLKLALPSINGTTFTEEWTRYSFELPELNELQASTYYYLTIKPESLSDGVSKLYIDDISLTYADAAGIPSDNWQTMFDWENEIDDAVKLVDKGNASLVPVSGSGAVAPSEQGLRITRSAWNNVFTSYVQIDLDPELMQNVFDIRLNYRVGYKSSLGVMIDGVVYWGGSSWFGGNLNSTTWSQFSVTGYTYGNLRFDGSSPEVDPITITPGNLKEVEALCFLTRNAYSSNSYWIELDDIEYILNDSAQPAGPTASFEGTETPVESISGTSIVMPEGTVAGKLFAGWSDGENLYAAGSTVEIEENTTFTAIGIDAATQDGAAVRLLEPTGLRFETRINKADYDAITALGATVKTGTLILPKDYLTEDIVLTKESLDANEKIYLDVANSGWYNAETAETDGYYQYFATIANIKTKNYDRTFTSAGYVEVTYADGESVVLLYCGDGSNTERAVSSVAQTALDDPNGNYTEAEKAILQGYLKAE